jgi:hypothetical protein
MAATTLHHKARNDPVKQGGLPDAVMAALKKTAYGSFLLPDALRVFSSFTQA